MAGDPMADLFGEATGLFRRPALADPAVGGKARSLARLASFGLPVPAAFVIVPASDLPVLQMDGPPPPPALRTPQDLAALDEARAAMLVAPFSAPLRQGLPRALAALAPAGQATFAVRSSSALEDSAQAAAPGVFDSVLRVSAAEVPDAVRTVLASGLAPAAWAYVLRVAPRPAGPIAVLVHRFVEGNAHGAVVGEPTSGEPRVQIDVQEGVLTINARGVIEAAARRVAAGAGAVELEWTANGDAVTFLQLRPFRSGRGAAAEGPMGLVGADGWIWDAAHNPAPLTPAQQGLVEWVDARCALGFRQRVIDGYLFYRVVPVARAPSRTPRETFAHVEAQVTAGVAALGWAPKLEAALAMYTRGYEGLFGAVQPACAAARAALRDFLRAHAPAALARWHALVEEGVPSAATRRREAASAIADARDATGRAAAIAAYLEAFGDESARWDVAEPTLRERPEALLFVRRAARAPTPVPRHRSEATTLAASLPERCRAEFLALVAAAREASAVAEDDDALFARLQAVVRAALRALGARLVAEQRFTEVDDVFYLAFEVTRTLDEGGEVQADLEALAASGRAAFAAAASRPPAPPPLAAGAAAVVGQRGATGRAIGRVVLHPAPAAPGPAGPAVVVAATLLPTELPLIEAAALVVETGTPLGHVAAQARERGIPAVVGAPGACAAFHPGQLVLVDGDRGLVIPLDESERQVH